MSVGKDRGILDKINGFHLGISQFLLSSGTNKLMIHTVFLAPETGQPAGQFPTRTAEGVGVWPQWQGQQPHHRSSSGEQHVQQPSAQQTSQPEVFQVRSEKTSGNQKLGEEGVKERRQGNLPRLRWLVGIRWDV